MGKVPMCRAVGDESSVYQFRIFFTRTYFLSEKQEKKFSEKKGKEMGWRGREKKILRLDSAGQQAAIDTVIGGGAILAVGCRH